MNESIKCTLCPMNLGSPFQQITENDVSSGWPYLQADETDSLDSPGKPALDVYMILRVFNLGQGNIGLRISVNPAAMEYGGRLVFEPGTDTVFHAQRPLNQNSVYHVHRPLLLVTTTLAQNIHMSTSKLRYQVFWSNMFPISPSVRVSFTKRNLAH